VRGVTSRQNMAVEQSTTNVNVASILKILNLC
jgi:hypothetical protein